jgi:hypothetical protein
LACYRRSCARWLATSDEARGKFRIDPDQKQMDLILYLFAELYDGGNIIKSGGPRVTDSQGIRVKCPIAARPIQFAKLGHRGTKGLPISQTPVLSLEVPKCAFLAVASRLRRRSIQ